MIICMIFFLKDSTHLYWTQHQNVLWRKTVSVNWLYLTPLFIKSMTGIEIVKYLQLASRYWYFWLVMILKVKLQVSHHSLLQTTKYVLINWNLLLPMTQFKMIVIVCATGKESTMEIVASKEVAVVWLLYRGRSSNRHGYRSDIKYQSLYLPIFKNLPEVPLS